MADTFAGKYTPDFFNRFIATVKLKYPAFDSTRLLGLIYDDRWEQKQLKQRIRHISTSLRLTLPASYRDALSVLTQIAPECKGVEYLFFPDFVEVYGLDDWTSSIPALDVQKSVANNLNDISKDHPDQIKQLAYDWYGENLQTNWIVKHGCRGLLRKGDPDVLSLFGFEISPDVTVSGLSVDEEILAIGQSLNFSFSIRTNSSVSQRLRVEYAIDFVKANRTTSKKLFKITEHSYDNVERQYKRTHHFKDLTTRKHYPGKHRLSIIINGKELAATDFYVTVATSEHT